MDNTILRSRIDFGYMEQNVYEFLLKKQVIPNDIPLNEFTSSTIIELARLSPNFSSEVENDVWGIVKELEKKGMENADLDSGVMDLLKQLHDCCHLTVLTNNSQVAALKALKATKIEHYFDHIIGREQVSSKPSPSGMNYIISLYPHLTKGDWLTVGDAWIDGKAAMDAGIKFIAYQANQLEFERRGIYPICYINEIKEILDYL
jgi:phosphoglycolate phosphatase